MKINVEVDLTDFYSEEDSASFSEEIKNYISYNVRNEILKDWKEKISQEFNKAVIAEVEKQKESFITSTMEELIVNAKVKKRYSSDELISISDWIKEELERAHLTDGKIRDFLNDKTKKTAENISNELKNRYDLLFASQIVSKLNENGMLKESVAEMLLEKNKDK